MIRTSCSLILETIGDGLVASSQLGEGSRFVLMLPMCSEA